MMHVKQWSNFEVDLTELKTAKFGYLDCTRDILQIHVINEMIKCVFMIIFRIIFFFNTVVLFFISYSKPCSSVSRIKNHSLVFLSSG